MSGGSEAEPEKCDCDGNMCGGSLSNRYCYADEGKKERTCHKYPLCKGDGYSETKEYPCDCDGDGDARKGTDCSGENGLKYCFEKQCYNIPKNVPDEKPLEIKEFKVAGKIYDFDPNRIIELEKGKSYPVLAVIKDDMPNGKETVELYIGKSIETLTNTGMKSNWEIEFKWSPDGLGENSVELIAKDSEQTTRISQKINVK